MTHPAESVPNERPNPKHLLADLESRQDELLRLLDELEQRTKQALAQLTVVPATTATVPEVKAA